jgi:uncharacterized damage-inducible protein DinB
MHTRDVLADAFGRIREEVHQAADGQSAEALAYRPDPDANSIAWLVWHLTRVQDDHVSEIAGREQAWVEGRWAGRMGMEPDPTNIGYGHTSEQVGAITPDDPDVLIDYHEAVHARTLEYLGTLDADELDRIIDTRWDPPVTVGVRLVSVIDDCMQHTGQANYVRGMIERRAAQR